MAAVILQRWKFHKIMTYVFLLVAELLCAALMGMSLWKSFSGLKALVWVALSLFILVLWFPLSKYWFHRQFQALWTLVLMDAGQNGVSENNSTAIKWMQSHPEIYDETLEITYTGPSDIDNIRKQIEMYRIPLILTDMEPPKELVELAEAEGVILHYISKDGRSPKGFEKVRNYDGLQAMIPGSIKG